MSFKEVKELRQQGNLEEAYRIALTELENNPEDIWNKRSIVWVFYDYLKIALESNRKDEFLKQLKNITDLQLPESEKYVFNAVAWTVGKFLFRHPNTDHSLLNQIFDLIKPMSFSKPDDSYSFLLKAFKKHASEWQCFKEFTDWWGLDNFLADDYKVFVTDEGRKIPSLAEGVYIALARSLLKRPVNQEPIRDFIPKITQLIKKYPEMQYPPYYYAKLLLALGDKEHFMEAFLPFARRKQRDFWIWHLMSENFESESEEYLSCLCKSASCGAPDKFTGEVREKLAKWFISHKMYPEAKLELQRILLARKDEGWHLQNKHLKWKTLDWWEATEATINNYTFYKKHLLLAESLLYANIKEELVIIVSINKERTVFGFVSETKKHGAIYFKNFKIKPVTGEVFSVRFKDKKDDKSNFYQLYSIVPSKLKMPENLFKEVSGVISIKPGNSFGFLNNIFVNPAVIKEFKLQNGDKITGRAVQTYNSKRKKWDWNIITLNK